MWYSVMEGLTSFVRADKCTSAESYESLGNELSIAQAAQASRHGGNIKLLSKLRAARIR